MYCVIVYDVGVERVNRIHKYLKRYLTWIQNSVFEGELSDADFSSVKKYIKENIDFSIDSFLIFRFQSKHSVTKEILGQERNSTDTII